jgi:predicted nuclease of predicted toxin-antitoxin system
LKLVADEGVDRQIVDRLRRDGFEVAYIAELDPGIGDDLVLGLAGQAGALLLTADKDFGELVFRRQLASEGVLLIRLAGLPPERKADLVVESLVEHGAEMLTSFSVISRTSLRIRKRTELF